MSPFEPTPDDTSFGQNGQISQDRIDWFPGHRTYGLQISEHGDSGEVRAIVDTGNMKDSPVPS